MAIPGTTPTGSAGTTAGYSPGPKYRATGPKAALRHCCAAWRRAIKLYGEKNHCSGVGSVFAEQEASSAYCNAMSLLDGPDGIRDYIACAAHGIVIGAIPNDRSGQVLYAAQVAREAKAPKSK